MKNFKYLLILTVVLTIPLFSCSNDDNEPHDYHFEYVNVIDVEHPDEFEFGNKYEMKITIVLPNSCYFFYDEFDYIHKGTSRFIYPIAHIDDGLSCAQSITETTFTIPIQVQQDEDYTFNFYQGKDEGGEDKLLTIKVPVTIKSQKS